MKLVVAVFFAAFVGACSGNCTGPITKTTVDKMLYGCIDVEVPLSQRNEANYMRADGTYYNVEC